MELEAEDGCVIFIPRGCKKELGRGQGTAVQDRTVSRHQILAELQEPRLKVGSVDKASCHGKLNVRVLGPNPVCIVHSRKHNINSTGKGSAAQGMILLRKDETALLSVGDQISLSITRPVFFTLKEGGQKMKNATSGSIVGEHSKEELFANVNIGNQVTDDDLLTSWKARKKEKETGTTEDKLMKRTIDDGTSHIIEGDKTVANEEEDGIAEAVARRQRRAHERLKQKQQKQQVEFYGNSREAVGGPSLVKENENNGREAEFKFIETEGIDPVKEFGFIVEGSEFEQYGKRHRLGGKWDMSPPCNFSDEDEEHKGMQVQHLTPSKMKKSKKDQDDEDWLGEDPEERVEITTVKTTKPRGKLNLRSHGPSSSFPKEVITEARRDHSHDMETDQSEEDETLGGFIVADDEEEGENSDEEDEWCDDDDIDEEECNNSNRTLQQNKPSRQDSDKRPLCRYGRDCYRKNKEHLEEYQH